MIGQLGCRDEPPRVVGFVFFSEKQDAKFGLQSDLIIDFDENKPPLNNK